MIEAKLEAQKMCVKQYFWNGYKLNCMLVCIDSNFSIVLIFCPGYVMLWN